MAKLYSSLLHTHGLDFWIPAGKTQTRISIDIYKNLDDYIKIQFSIFDALRNTQTITHTFMPYSGSLLYLLSQMADILTKIYMDDGSHSGSMVTQMLSHPALKNLHLHTLSNTPLKIQDIKYG